MPPEVIIPRFAYSNNNLRYFVPRFTKIHRGETVRWTNLDNQHHILLFYYFINDEGYSLGQVGPLAPNESQTMTFDYEYERIDYYCQFHPNERGSVIIFPMNEESMSNTDRIKFLSRNFGIGRFPY